MYYVDVCLTLCVGVRGQPADSLLPESFRDQTLVAQDDGKCSYLLSRLSGLKVIFPTRVPCR